MRADLCDRPENVFFSNRKGDVRALRMRAPPSLADFFMRWPKLRLRSLGYPPCVAGHDSALAALPNELAEPRALLARRMVVLLARWRGDAGATSGSEIYASTVAAV